MNTKLDNKTLTRIAIKAVAVWLALSLAGFFWGDRLINMLTPYYEYVVETTNPDYIASIRIDADKTEPSIVLAATALKALPITAELSLAAGKTIESSITVLHALVPIVILLTFLLVWPVKQLNQRLILVILAIPAIYLVSTFTAPLQLLGQLEIGFVNAAAKYGVLYEQSWVLKWMLVTEGGGRWLIPVLTGVLCGSLVNRFAR